MSMSSAKFVAICLNVACEQSQSQNTQAKHPKAKKFDLTIDMTGK